MIDIIKEYTVSEVVKGIKNVLEKEFFYIKIKGEISNFKKHPSGHLYFSLKDNDSIINIVMFKQYADFCKIDLMDGLEIITAGKLTIYKERSNYQLLAETIQISGIGTLLKLIQERKDKLSKEGLFDIERKKPIPKFPKSVGLITAESGAAIHDILSRLENRTPISLSLYSVLMQGKEAPIEIIKAIKYFNGSKNKPNVIVITRGGGSIEDLMAFNDEDLVRAVANSKIPIISAIGHEVDWTLIDYASDLRLPTPTSVAEYLTMSKEQAYKNLDNLAKRLYIAVYNQNTNKINKIHFLFKNILLRKSDKFSKNINSFKFLNFRFQNLFKIIIENFKRKIITLNKIDINKIIKEKYARLFEKIKIIVLQLENYKNKYPIFKDILGNVVELKSEIILNKNYILEFPDGNIKVKVIKI